MTIELILESDECFSRCVFFIVCVSDFECISSLTVAEIWAFSCFLSLDGFDTSEVFQRHQTHSMSLTHTM